MNKEAASTQQPANADLRRRRAYRASQLIRWRAELVAKRRAGASLAALVAWLGHTHRVRVARSTLLRALRAWPEAPDHA